MATRVPQSIGEWYHCYNRGVDKRKTFLTKENYERFLTLLFVANREESLHISNLKQKTFQNILSDESFLSGIPIVEIGAYCLMPNHFHIALKEIRKGGIALFMQKVCTGYTMYFNKMNTRTGSLFAGTYKSKHVADDRYIKHLISYILCNPAELSFPKWKTLDTSLSEVEIKLKSYKYSSLSAFLDPTVLERKLLGESIFDLYDDSPSIGKMLLDVKNMDSYQG